MSFDRDAALTLSRTALEQCEQRVAQTRVLSDGDLGQPLHEDEDLRPAVTGGTKGLPKKHWR